MFRASRRPLSSGSCRVALVAGGLALLTLGGCAVPQQTRELGVVARDAATGQTLEGVRIFRNVGSVDAQSDSVAITDPAGVAVFEAPVSNSVWLVMRDGYEPLLVDLRDEEDTESKQVVANEVVVHWSDVLATGMLDLPMSPITWRTVWISVVNSETGAPVARASVVSEALSLLDPDQGGTRFGVPIAVGTLTDGGGVAMIDLPSGSRCKVSVAADGHAETRVVLDPTSPDGIATHTTIQLEAHRYEPTRVIVLDRGTGLPVEGATIRVGLLDPETRRPRHHAIWTTDAEGTAIVMKPAAGLGTLMVEHEGRAQSDFRVLEIHATEFDTVAIGADDLD
jgi:hypothetical protein